MARDTITCSMCNLATSKVMAAVPALSHLIVSQHSQTLLDAVCHSCPSVICAYTVASVKLYRQGENCGILPFRVLPWPHLRVRKSKVLKMPRKPFSLLPVLSHPQRSP